MTDEQMVEKATEALCDQFDRDEGSINLRAYAIRCFEVFRSSGGVVLDEKEREVLEAASWAERDRGNEEYARLLDSVRSKLSRPPEGEET